MAWPVLGARMSRGDALWMCPPHEPHPQGSPLGHPRIPAAQMGRWPICVWTECPRESTAEPASPAADAGLTRPEAIHSLVTRTAMVSHRGVGVYEVDILIQIPRGTSAHY